MSRAGWPDSPGSTAESPGETNVSLEHPLFLTGRWERPGDRHPVTNPYDQTVVGITWMAGPAQFEEAGSAAVAAAPVMRALPAFERAAVLARTSFILAQRREEIGRTLAG